MPVERKREKYYSANIKERTVDHLKEKGIIGRLNGFAAVVADNPLKKTRILKKAWVSNLQHRHMG